MNSIYRSHIEQASAIKLSALRARAGDDGDFEAAVVLHEAARAEVRALRSLPDPDPPTRLRSAVERCGLLIDAGDATAVVRDAWPGVLERAENLSDEHRAAYLDRLAPAVDRLLADLDGLSQKHPHLVELPSALSGRGRVRRDAIRKDLGAYLTRFAGDTAAWLSLVWLDVARGDEKAAWSTVARLRRLDPEDALAREVEINLAVGVLPAEKLRARLDGAADDVLRDLGGVHLALGTAVGYLHLGVGVHAQRGDLDRAEQIARRALLAARGTYADARPYLRALLFFVSDARAGRPLRAEVFRRVGLPELVRRAEGDDPAQMLRRAPPHEMPALAV